MGVDAARFSRGLPAESNSQSSASASTMSAVIGASTISTVLMPLCFVG